MQKLPLQAKYDLSATHPDLLAIADKLNHKGYALDAGCNKGRNTLFLESLGMQVDALDADSHRIAYLQNIITAESLSAISAQTADLTSIEFTKTYDFINLTMVLHLIEPDAVNPLLKKLQNATKKSGYNFIIAPLNTHNVPNDFKFCFTPDALRQAYADWHIEKYEEDWGLLGRKNPDGERIRMMFATLLAKKP